MKKNLLSAVAGVAVIGSAFAVPNVEVSKNLCAKHPDKYVWVEKNEDCIPINPCESKNETIKEVYCNRAFEFVQLGNWREAIKLVKAYSENVLKVSVTNTKEIAHDKDTSLFGQDYIPVKTSDGGYVMFEFDDLSDMTKSDKEAGAFMGACKAFGRDYHRSYSDKIKSWVTYCMQVQSQKECDDIAGLASDVMDKIVKGDYEPEPFKYFVKQSWQDKYSEHEEDDKCYLFTAD